METNINIVPPHLIAEAYRSDTSSSNKRSHPDFIRLHSDSSVLIGCSELTGRYWCGGAVVSKNVSVCKRLNSDTKMSIDLKTGTSDGCFIESSSKVLLCEDSGAISIWKTNEDNIWKTWTEVISVAEHDDGIMSVDCLDPGKEYVTAGADGHLKVWDISDMICTRNYSAAHSKAIYCVSVRPKSVTDFASASLDQFVSFWDENVVQPIIEKRNDCGVRCVQWLDESRLVYGDEAGALRWLDVKNTKEDHEITTFPAAVHRVAVQHESGLLAVCCDNSIVSVCDINKLETPKIIYKDKVPNGTYVRGLAWDPTDKNLLYSIAWDGEIRKHKVK